MVPCSLTAQMRGSNMFSQKFILFWIFTKLPQLCLFKFSKLKILSQTELFEVKSDVSYLQCCSLTNARLVFVIWRKKNKKTLRWDAIWQAVLFISWQTLMGEGGPSTQVMWLHDNMQNYSHHCIRNPKWRRTGTKTLAMMWDIFNFYYF